MGPANGHLVRASPVAVTHAQPLCHEVEIINDNDDYGADRGDGRDDYDRGYHIDDGDLKIISGNGFVDEL